MSNAGRASYRAALRVRDLRLVLSALLIDQLGGWAYSAALTIYVWDRTHSTGLVAVSALTRMVPVLLFSPYAGVLADRLERLRLMVTMDLMNFVWVAAAAVAIQVHSPLAVVLVLATASALTDTPYRSAVSAVLPAVAGEDQLASANALNGTIANLTILAGPAIGALLISAGSPAAAFWLDAVTYLVAAFLVARCRTRSPGTDVTEGGRAGALAQMRSGLDAIVSSPTVLLLTALCALDSFYGGLTKVFFVSISLHVGTGPAGYGYLISAFGVGGLLAALVSNRLASFTRLAPVIVGGLAVLYLPLLVQPAISSPVLTAALQALAGGGMLVVDVVAVTALQRAVPQDHLARVFGVFWALIVGTISLGTVLAPLSLQWLGYAGGLTLFGAGVIGVAVACYPALYRADSRARQALTALLPKVTLLEGLQLFAAASRPVLERLARAATEVDLPAGTPVVTEGETADALYVLAEGDVRVSARGEAGLDREIRRMTAPCYFGEIGVLEHIARTATVTTVAPCRLLKIDGEEFLAAMSESPASPSLVEGVRARLAVTHPSRPVTVNAPPTAPVTG